MFKTCCFIFVIAVGVAAAITIRNVEMKKRELVVSRAVPNIVEYRVEAQKSLEQKIAEWNERL